jgi:hypothetical protein
VEKCERKNKKVRGSILKVHHSAKIEERKLSKKQYKKISQNGSIRVSRLSAPLDEVAISPIPALGEEEAEGL